MLIEIFYCPLGNFKYRIVIALNIAYMTASLLLNIGKHKVSKTESYLIICEQLFI